MQTTVVVYCRVGTAHTTFGTSRGPHPSSYLTPIEGTITTEEMYEKTQKNQKARKCPTLIQVLIYVGKAVVSVIIMCSGRQQATVVCTGLAQNSSAASLAINTL